jgi:hypothetical protein
MYLVQVKYFDIKSNNFEQRPIFLTVNASMALGFAQTIPFNVCGIIPSLFSVHIYKLDSNYLYTANHEFTAESSIVFEKRWDHNKNNWEEVYLNLKFKKEAKDN